MSDQPEVLREYRVNIVPTDDAHPIDSNDLGLRTKFGGLPTEIQTGASKMTCPHCREKMRFIGQIDSFEFDGKNNPNRKGLWDTQFMFGDVGMIYVWFCFDCLEPIATMECY